jgi:hypothetical protein
MPWRSCLSNVLFLCVECHRRYEAAPEPDLTCEDWREFVTAWKEHFVSVLRPAHLPEGWDIVSLARPEAAGRRGEES